MAYEYKQFYRRKLPHLHSPGGTIFSTFRLAGSVPKNVLARYKFEKELLDKKLEESDDLDERAKERLLKFHREWFVRFEKVLHESNTGPHWLKEPKVASLVYESILHRNGHEYDLHGFTLMSNHGHMVFTPYLNERTLTELRKNGRTAFKSSVPTLEAIMQSLKGYTARAANEILGRTGRFWETESFDREIRSGEEFSRTIRYVLNNPVKAGLVQNWEDWRWSWRAET